MESFKVSGDSTHFQWPQPLQRSFHRLPTPTMPTPKTRSVLGSMINLVKPSVRSKCKCASRGGPGEFYDRDFASGFGRFNFRQSAPGDFGIGKDNGKDGLRFKSHLFSGNRFHRHTSFVGSFVREHGVPWQCRRWPKDATGSAV